ncbi:helix-turn-helix domain-containing protein [Carboxylicivirga sediminis]|uniref:Helix-turn-helix domain-containing protein n=1 Tax=Carboxylicivirga sediminis TaxID=2006564 RepID=A0A941F6Q6_9BACT|nr:helix-turn-helix domain-containing protein [Carboxylicivirga sediminis]MBR8537801.1 helix-turn-helix domain-containing protein [Carboxylicivirga sediminis]
MDEAFINQLKELVMANLSDEHFGVSELAAEAGMSRSNLLRRIQKEQGCSASQFIRNIRLEEGMNLLLTESKTVSEVTYMVGFNSTSYFIKCFREQYGYPPGEAGQHQVETGSSATLPTKPSRTWIWITATVALLTVAFILFTPRQKQLIGDKSIAVLPFINDSNDSSNVYVVNGLMESILNKLQALQGLKVVSRTSVEKYRNSELTLPEIASELGVRYILEGSGQKQGNEILLSVQLIDATTDDHLWAEQYNQQMDNIFALQLEVAEKITSAIELTISPEEQERLNQAPTSNLVAYDYYLKGLDQLHKETNDGLNNGIALLRKAVNEDEYFALAHGVLSIAYYYKDRYVPNTTLGDSLIYYADKALLLNPQLAPALTGKALYYLQNNDVHQALEYLEKALEYNPNSATVINTLSDIYTNHIPNTGKYLEYALMGINLDIHANDSNTASYIYLHLSNALVQNGFVDEAIKSINKSLSYNPDNSISEYVKAYIVYAKNQDIKETEAMLHKALGNDSTRFDILIELGNVNFYQRNWEEARSYFDRYLQICHHLRMDPYPHKNIDMAYTYRQLGQTDKADELVTRFKAFIEQDQSVYRHLFWASYYAYLNQNSKAIEQLQQFTQQEQLQIWVPLFTPHDPLFDNIRYMPEFKTCMREIDTRFWQNHKKLKKQLNSKHLLDNI